MNSPLVFSRPAAAAQTLSESALDSHRFLEKHVAVIVEPECASTANGKLILDACLRLLPRICRNIRVQLAGISQDVVSLCARAVAETIPSGISMSKAPVSLEATDVVLVIGSNPLANRSSIAVNCNGWLARLSTAGSALDSRCDKFNPVGAFAAACLATSEVFKQLIVLSPERAESLGTLSFSFFSYEETADPGPDLPSLLEVDLLLAGAGAIGSAVTYLMQKLRPAGELHIVDPQFYAEENLGTTIILGAGDLGVGKAAKCVALLKSPVLNAVPFAETIERYARRKEYKYKVVLSGLDSVAARHEVQKLLWPDVVIDGATGAVQAQVFRHRFEESEACLLCYFKEPSSDSRNIAAQATGLDLTRVGDQLSILTEDDIMSAKDEMKSWLSERKGKTLCSIVQEAVALSLSADLTFEPAAPFVAGLSAAMMVGELIKNRIQPDCVFDTCFQFDTLIGPAGGTWSLQKPDAGCLCQARRKNIEIFRERRET